MYCVRSGRRQNSIFASSVWVHRDQASKGIDTDSGGHLLIVYRSAVAAEEMRRQ